MIPDQLDNSEPARATECPVVPGLASVLISNFNYGPFVSAAIESALAQTYKPSEVIVVDDASSDDSADVIARYADRITVISHHVNRGQGASVNSAFQASRGEIIFLLDADDEFKSRKLTRVMDIYSHHKEIGSCFHNVERIYTGVQKSQQERLSTEGAADYRPNIRVGRPPFIATPTSGESFRRSVFERLLPIPEFPGIGVSDHYLKWGALALAQTYFLGDVLAAQRIHGRNAYSGTADMRSRGSIALLNAHTFRTRFPELSAFTDKLFLEAVVAFRVAGGPDKRSKEMLSDYLGSLTASERALIRARVLARRLPPPVRRRFARRRNSGS
jgi:glycosyltransferase involved in cell wall biosynthesis